MTSEPRYILENQIGFLLRKANQRHRALFSSEVDNKIAPTQFSALAKLHELGPISQNQLGRLIAVDSATIKGVVERLGASGYVRGERSPDDARLRIIHLTDDGLATIERLLPLAERITEATLDPLSRSEVETLTYLLAKISR